MLSLEVHGLIRYMAASGVPFKVTDIDTPGVHVDGSYHYAEGTNGNGLAVDFAGMVPSVRSDALAAIVNAFEPVRSQLVEFLHPWNRPDHADHVHVAVRKGVILKEERKMEPVPPETRELLTAFAYQDGYVLVARDGAVYCFNCQYQGGLQWDGHNWGPR